MAIKKRKKTSKMKLNSARAYWIGVGISTQVHGEGQKVLEGKFKKNVIAGYKADNNHNVSEKFR